MLIGLANELMVLTVQLTKSDICWNNHMVCGNYIRKQLIQHAAP